MKVKINGVEIEADANDIKALLLGLQPTAEQEKIPQIIKEVKYEEPKPAPNRHGIGGRKKQLDWDEVATDVAQFIRRQPYPVTISHALDALGRSTGVINTHVFNKLQDARGIRNIGNKYMSTQLFSQIRANEQQESKPTRKDKPEVVEARAQRLREIHKHAKAICAKDNRMPYNEAYMRAAEAWKSGNTGTVQSTQEVKEEKKESKKPEFPSIFPMADSAKMVLADILLSKVMQKKSLVYYDVLYSVQLQEGYAWNGRVWREFITQLCYNNKHIIEALNIKGKFVMERDGSFDIVKFLEDK